MLDPRPGWLDPALYPFAPHFLDLPMGDLHYVDEGSGEPIVFVHGTPTWSFLWRDLIRGLAPERRCVAPDHIGFGLSDKPVRWTYRPQDHAANLDQLIERLGLEGLTLVVHDFGGPLGLRYAVQNPDNVRRLVLFNTWMWSLRGQRRFEQVSRFVTSRVGTFLYRQLNFSPRVVLKYAFADRSRLSSEIHRHYLRPLATPNDRKATWIMGRELIASSDWLDELWRRRDRLRGKPALILWGMKDPAFGRDELERWRALLPDAKVVELPGVGHFVPEEAPEQVLAQLRAFLSATS